MKKTDLDTCGLLCPLPVLKLRKAMSGLSTGDQVHLRADDPASQIDVPHFCQEAGHNLLRVQENANVWLFEVEVAGR